MLEAQFLQPGGILFPTPMRAVRSLSVHKKGPEQRRLNAGAKDHLGEHIHVKAIFGF